MGKVYDALRRAEEQRDRRASEAVVRGGASVAEETAPVVPTVPVPPPAAHAPPPIAPAAPPVVRPRIAFWKRWLGRRSQRPLETPGALNKRRISLLQPESFVAEQFRTLRARIDSIAGQQPMRSIAVTSAVAGEGKTTAATNLALVASMNVEQRVLLVDCDLRRPRIHQSLGLRPEVGIAEVLNGKAELDEAILRLEGTSLDVLPVRTLPPNPSELLSTQRMQELIEECVGRYDRVVFDVPPTLGLPEAKTLSDLCDGIVLVVRADETPSTDVESALEVLDRRRILGLVLNGASTEPSRYGYAGY